MVLTEKILETAELGCLNGGIAMPWMTRACIGSRSCRGHRGLS